MLGNGLPSAVVARVGQVRKGRGDENVEGWGWKGAGRDGKCLLYWPLKPHPKGKGTAKY